LGKHNLRRAVAAKSAALLSVAALLLGAACGRRAPPPVPGQPPLAFAVNLLDFEVGLGAREPRDVRVTGPASARAKLAIEAVEGDVVAALLAPEAGQPAGVRLTFIGRRVGRAVGRVVVATGLPPPEEPASLVLFYEGRVAGNLEVSPSNPYLDLGGGVVVVTVTSRRAGFALRGAEIAAGPFTARLSGTARVEVSVVAAKVPAGARGAIGKLILVSNDPDEPRKEVPLFAMGRVGP